MLNKSISLSSQVNSLTLKEKLIFTWSIPHLDDYGLLQNDAKVIKATVCPMTDDIKAKEINGFIQHAHELGLIEVYEDCIEFTGFTNHQSISAEKRAKCKFKKIIPKNPQENSGENNNPQKSPVQDKRSKDKIREDNSNVAVADNNPESEINKQIPLLIELFKPINPSHDRLFSNKTQRSALERMIKKYSYQKVEAMIKALPEIVGKPYAPTITTPYQLETNLGKLILFVKKEEIKTPLIAKIF